MGSNGGVRTKPAILGIYSRESRPIARIPYIFVHYSTLRSKMKNLSTSHDAQSREEDDGAHADFCGEGPALIVFQNGPSFFLTLLIGSELPRVAHTP